MNIDIYTTATCPICDKTKSLFDKWGMTYNSKPVDTNRENLITMSKITNGARTVPQIVINGKWIGSFSELTELHMDGFFDNT